MSTTTKYIGWFSCGATSSVACKIAIDEGKDVDLWYFENGGAGSYCSDGEVSGSTHERYFHDIAEIQTQEQTDD